jgi:hypothetical protein
VREGVSREQVLIHCIKLWKQEQWGKQERLEELSQGNGSKAQEELQKAGTRMLNNNPQKEEDCLPKTKRGSIQQQWECIQQRNEGDSWRSDASFATKEYCNDASKSWC